MGTTRGNGYRVDSPHSAPSSSSSPKLNGCTPVAPYHSPQKKAPPCPSPAKTPAGSRRPGERVLRHRRHKDTGCRNPQVRKGIGSCVFVLGIPCLIAGLILTIVSSTDDGGDSRKYPSAFPVLGPVLLALSVICFLTGILLYNIAILKHLQDCLGLADRDSFCRRRFPRLCAWFSPDPNLARNQMAINNLQTAPARSALRKMPNPDLVAMETEGQGLRHDSDHHHHHHHHHLHPEQLVPRRKRAVTFSQGDDDDEGGFVGVRLNSNSTGSEADGFSVQSENGAGGSGLNNGQSPSASLLSLRHCRIYPRDEVFWTDSSADTRRGDEGERAAVEVGEDQEGGKGGGGDDDDNGGGGGKRPGVNSSAQQSVEVVDEGGGWGGRNRGRVSLTSIDEEGV